MWTTVIGVVKDVVYSRDGIVILVFYPSARQWYTTDRQLVLRTTSDPNALTGAVRNVVQSIDRTLPRVAIATVENQLAEQDKPRIFQTGLIGIFAGLAVVLAAKGLYGLMAYSVEQRTKEIGIRVAIGSTRAGIALLVLQTRRSVGSRRDRDWYRRGCRFRADIVGITLWRGADRSFYACRSHCCFGDGHSVGIRSTCSSSW